jgi:hypothetical protein
MTRRNQREPEKFKASVKALGTLRDALNKLESMPEYDLSQAELASDNVASALITIFLPGRKNPFIGRAPALYEVIEKLHERFDLEDEAVDAAYEMKSRIEDSYRFEEEDDIGYEVKEYADDLIDRLNKFVQRQVI